jgi:hypothetical protein
MTAHPSTTGKPTTSKRHSLSLATSSGPRPLRLVDSPATPPSAFQSLCPERSNSTPPSSANKFRGTHPRRQSSIAYHTRDREVGRDFEDFERDAQRSSSGFSQVKPLSRSISLGSASRRNGTVRGDGRSTESTPSGSMTPERSPLTPAEK